MAASSLVGGAASIDVTPSLGRDVQGASVFKKAASVRDPLEANAIYLANATTKILFIGVDVVAVSTEWSATFREAIAAATGVPATSIWLTGTHMHSGPSMIGTCREKPLDLEYHELLGEKLVTIAKQAVDGAVPVMFGVAQGRAQLGYNRRCCWADGSHSMHGDTTRPEFTGLEGPDDPTHTTFTISDMDRKPIAIWYSNTTHPTCFYGADFWSADFPGETRRLVRDALGQDMAVIFFNGAFGDISNGNMLSYTPRSNGGEEAMKRMGALAAGETIRLYHDATWTDTLDIREAHDTLAVGVRLPTPERLAWAQDALARHDAGEQVSAFDRMFGFGITSLQAAYGDDPVDHLGMHALRLGDLAIASNPCELYCQFGLDIRRRSPAPLTALAGQLNGYHGYCPTVYGIIGGGYSGEPIAWTRLELEAGYKITDTACRLLYDLWRD